LPTRDRHRQRDRHRTAHIVVFDREEWVFATLDDDEEVTPRSTCAARLAQPLVPNALFVGDTGGNDDGDSQRPTDSTDAIADRALDVVLGAFAITLGTLPDQIELHMGLEPLDNVFELDRERIGDVAPSAAGGLAPRLAEQATQHLAHALRRRLD